MLKGLPPGRHRKKVARIVAEESQRHGLGISSAALRSRRVGGGRLEAKFENLCLDRRRRPCLEAVGLHGSRGAGARRSDRGAPASSR